jgi:Zn-dependent peptidase ImmA (M78 family)
MDEYGFPQFGTLEDGVALKKRAQLVAREIRAACGQLRAVPFDPRGCAEHFGLNVQGTDLPGDLSGRLSSFRDVPRIEFNQTHPETRVRFTISHELGHLCFLDKKPISPRERGEIGAVPKAQQREERLCNMIATELLMPAAAFRRIAGALRPSLGSLGQMKELFGVSTASLLRRICELRVWSVGVAEWVVANGSTPRRWGRRRVVVKSAMRTNMEQQRVVRKIEGVLNKAEARICESLRNGHQFGGRLTTEVEELVLNVTPFGPETNRGARVLVLHP